jgi:hypothetical protein
MGHVVVDDRPFAGPRTTSAAHFHAVTATDGRGDDAAAAAVANVGVALGSPSLTGFPLGVTSGSYDQVIDLTTRHRGTRAS